MAGIEKSRRLAALALVITLTAALVQVAGPASAGGAFIDDDADIHEANIETIAALDITKGCNPPDNDRFCPHEVVTRGQMAAFLVRTFSLTAADVGGFTDTMGSVFEADIERLAAAGITRGCNPPANSRFCPQQPVTRGEMSAFLTRALGLTDLSVTRFSDTAGHVFESDISRLAAAGITRGCNPPANSRFCPDEPVVRDQMATFLARAYAVANSGTTASSMTTSSTSPPTSTSSSVTSSSIASSSSSSTTPSTTSSTTSSTTTTTPPSGSLALRVVTDPQRHNDRALEGARLAGNIFVSAEPEGAMSIDKVRFWIDGASGPADAVDENASWDLSGTEPSGDAMAWNTAGGTTALSEGTHTITAVAYNSSGIELASVSAGFTIDNDPPPVQGQVHLSWTHDPSTTMTVVWHTDQTSTPSEVRYRASGTSDWTPETGGLKTSGVAGTLHEVEITGLTAVTSYQFQVADDGGGWSAARTFRTAPEASGTFDFLYFADTGLAGRTDGLGVGVLQSISAMDALDPDLLLPGGDYAYNATGQCAQSDGRFDIGAVGLNQAIDQWFTQMDPLINDVPMMPTYGNHEVLLCEGFPAWADRFVTPRGVAGPDPGPLNPANNPPPVDDRGSYSFDVGAVHFISLLAVTENSALDTNVFDWLEADIEQATAAGADWIIPYFHATPISHGQNHDHNFALRNQLAPLFEEHEIPLVLFSHDQSFERTFPLTGLANGGAPITPTSGSLSCYTGTDPGVVWLKVSPSGKHSNKSGSFSPWLGGAPPPSWVARSNNTLHHFTRVAASPTELRVRTYGHDGLGSPAAVIDDFSIKGSCS